MSTLGLIKLSTYLQASLSIRPITSYQKLQVGVLSFDLSSRTKYIFISNSGEVKELRQEMSKMNQKLDKMADCLDSKKSHAKGVELFRFPLETLNDHAEFEKKILNPTMRARLVIYKYSIKTETH